MRKQYSKSEILASVAKARSVIRGISYAQALAQLAQEEPDFSASPSDVRDRRPSSRVLSQLMMERAEERNIQLSEALAQIKRENPELAQAAELEVTGRRRQAHRGQAVNEAGSQHIGGHMGKENPGAFSPAPPQPIVRYVLELAKDRVKRDGISLTAALSQIRNENPQLARAADMEMGTRGGIDGQPNFQQLLRKALEIAKTGGRNFEEALEQASVGNPELARAARAENGGYIYSSELRVPAGIGDKQVLMSEGVDAALNPDAHLTKLAHERARERSIPFRDALTQVAREHPELSRAHHEQVIGRKLP